MRPALPPPLVPAQLCYICLATCHVQICERLGSASPSYQFSSKDLAQLRLALQAADPPHRARIQLHSSILGRVLGSTGAAAEAFPSGAQAAVGPAGEGGKGGAVEGVSEAGGAGRPVPAGEGDGRVRVGALPAGAGAQAEDDSDEGISSDAERHWHDWYPPDQLEPA